METKNDAIIIKKSDIQKSEELALNNSQLNFLLSKTPKSAVKKRPAKGGGSWTYVSGAYMKKVLNMMFGWDWDFEIVSETVYVEAGEVVVKGKLTCRTKEKTIIKMQYGNKDIMFKRGTKDPLSIGNDLKAAATDALKKCAAELGIAQDVYAPLDFKEVQISDEKMELNPNSTNWDKIKESISNGNYTIKEIEEKYLLTAENKELLCSK